MVLTINTALGIPKETGTYLPAMSDQRKTQYRLTLKEVKISNITPPCASMIEGNFWFNYSVICRD